MQIAGASSPGTHSSSWAGHTRPQGGPRQLPVGHSQTLGVHTGGYAQCVWEGWQWEQQSLCQLRVPTSEEPEDSKFETSLLCE